MSEEPSWIGPPPRAAQAIAFMSCGIIGLMIAGMQPLLLGGLAIAGRVGANQLGQMATAEFLILGLTAGAAGSVLHSLHLRFTALAALAALAALDTLTPFARGPLLFLVRAAAGLPEGVLLWVTISLIARAPTPERWAGAFLTAQTSAQFMMAALLAAFVLPAAGVDGGFWAIAALCIAGMGAALLLPPALAPLPADATGGLPSARGWIALSVSFLFIAITSAVWVYVQQLSHQAHHDASVAGQAVSLSLIAQMAGALGATALAGRISWFVALVGCAAADLCLMAAIATLPGPAMFVILVSALGFIWLFAQPFLVPMTIEADPTRRAALLIGGAELVGGSLGPLFSSFFVTDADARGALGFSSFSVALAAAVVIALHLTRQRAPVAAAD
jgi:hypothetical protein